MKNKIKKFLFSETIKYILVGLLTTLLNIVIFRLLLFIFNKNLPDFKYNWFLAEVPAFIIAVLFAFFMDKYFVFKKTDTKVSETIQELELRLGDARRYFQLCQRRQAADLLQLSLHGYRLSLPTLGDKRGKRRPGD